MRMMAIGAIGALLLSVSLAYGQGSESTLPPGVSRTVHSAASVSLRVPDLDKTKPTFTAETTMVTAREIIFTGKVVVQIEGAQYTADRAVVSREGEIRFDGNVQVERPVPAGGPTHRVAIERSRTIGMVGEDIEPRLRGLLRIDGQKQVVVVLTDSAESIRANPR